MVSSSFDHDDPVYCCAMAGGLIAARDKANKLIVRSLATGAVAHTSFDHDGVVRCCAMAGGLIAAGDLSNKLIVWDLATAGNALPGEVPLSAARDRVRRWPHLIHRRGPVELAPAPGASRETTLLHRLVATTEVTPP